MKAKITHRCDGNLYSGYGLGDPKEKCSAYRRSDGTFGGYTCGEPCSWIMGKAGHGKPKWKNLPGNIRCNPSVKGLGRYKNG